MSNGVKRRGGINPVQYKECEHCNEMLMRVKPGPWVHSFTLSKECSNA